jgi:transcriptional regulator with XRE-family HTH domain
MNLSRKTKFGQILDKRGLSLTQFGELLYIKTGHWMSPNNISNYATGYKTISTIKLASLFAKALGVEINEII